MALTLLITVQGVPFPLQPDLGGLALRQATHELLHFLEVERSLELSAHATQQGSNRSAMPPYDVFRPACVAHTRKLTRTIDMAYTDEQLRTVLENECKLDKMFVSVETGFNDYNACKRFAKQLSDARNMELKDGSVEGYEKFCFYYYAYKGKLETSGQAKEKPSKENERAKEKRVIYESVSHEPEKANTTKNTTGSIVRSTKREMEPIATHNVSTKANLNNPKQLKKKRAMEEQRKSKDSQPSRGMALIAFGIILFILALVVVMAGRH